MSDWGSIPATWQWSTMATACEKIQDGTHFSPHESKQLARGPFPYVTAKNVRPSGLDFAAITFLAEADHRQIYERCDPRTGDVLLVKDGVNAGDAAINTFEGEISLLSSVAMLRPNANMLRPEFLRYYLLSPQGYRSLNGQMTGTAIKRIILRKIREMPVPIAAITEQRRIVAKIEELLSELDVGVAALQRAKANLKRYRAAVLKAAVEGKLTEDWRSRHACAEPASRLLTRILNERRHGWESDQLARFASAGKKPPKNWRDKYVEPPPPGTTDSPELPQGWCWASIEQLASPEPRSIQSGPFGSNLLHSEFRDTGILAIGIDNVLDGRFSLGRQHRISPAKFVELEKYEARPLDVLVTVMATVGRSCVVPADLERAIITKHVYRISTNHSLMNPYFLQLALSGGVAVRRQIYGEVRGQTRPGINGDILKKVAIPVPSLDEQEQILAAVAERLSNIEAGNASIDHGLVRASRLRQSILKRAFEGKLVPQDPADERASLMLERIRGQSAHDGGKPRSPRRGRGRTSKQATGKAKQ